MNRTQLKQIIREVVEARLSEMPRIATKIKVGDAQKLQQLATQYQGTWVGQMLQLIQKSGDEGVTQVQLAQSLGKTRQQNINGWIRKFQAEEAITLGDLETPKKVKSSGPIGRPVSKKSEEIRNLFDKFKEDSNYQPSPEETTTLAPEDVQKIKARATGTLKKGRPLGAAPAPDADYSDDDLINV